MRWAMETGNHEAEEAVESVVRVFSLAVIPTVDPALEGRLLIAEPSKRFTTSVTKCSE